MVFVHFVLALVGRKAFATRLREVERNGPDVVREVDVLGESGDGLVCLRKRCPSLEDKVRSEGCREERFKRPTTQTSF